jgi:hypothetical protein
MDDLGELLDRGLTLGEHSLALLPLLRLSRS